MTLAGGLEKRFDAAERNLADFGGDDLRVAEVGNEVLLDDLGSDEVGGAAKHVGVLIARSSMRVGNWKMYESMNTWDTEVWYLSSTTM